MKAITLGISSKQNNDTNFHFIFVTMNGDDSDNNSLNDNQNDGDDLVPPRRIEFQQKFDATLANAESNYARNSIEMNNFNLMKNFCIQRNVDAIGLEDLMNQPNGNYMRTFIIGIIVSWGVGGIGGKAAEYSSGRGQRGGSQRSGGGQITYDRFVRVACIQARGATNIATLFIKPKADQEVYGGLNNRDSGAFGEDNAN